MAAPEITNSVLDEAAKIIHGPRRESYGRPLDNHTRTAEMWNIYLGKRFPGIQMTAEDVCMLNILQKISRCITTSTITRDTLVDIVGYAGNVELIWNDQPAKSPQQGNNV